MRSFALLALVGAAVAADTTTTTVDLFLPVADKQPLVGSVVKVESDRTTFAISCPPGADSDDCGFAESQTVMQGESTWSMTFQITTGGGLYSNSLACELTPQKDVASCTGAVSEEVSNSVFQTTVASQQPGFSQYLIPVTITAGADKLKGAAPGPTGKDATATNTGDASKPTATGDKVSNSSDASKPAATGSKASDSADAAKTTTTSNAVGAMATQNVLLAGAAALVGGVMAL